MRNITNLTIGILLAVLCFFATLFNLFSYVATERLLDLIFAISDAICCAMCIWMAYRNAKALDEYICQKFTLNIFLSDPSKENDEKVCKVQNNSVTLQGEDKGSPSPAE